VLDPFPAAITSPSHHRHAGAGSHDGGLNGSSSRMYHEVGAVQVHRLMVNQGPTSY
jgi:hypothetical protein